MGRATAVAAASDKIGGVEVLVPTHGAASSDIVLDHVERSGTLSPAAGLGQSRINDKRIAVLRHQMSHVAELGLLACGFAEQPGIGIGGRGMRIVAALLATEVTFRIAPAAPAAAFSCRWVAAILRHEALHTGPGFDQRAVNGEVLAGEQTTYLPQVENARNELRRD